VKSEFIFPCDEQLERCGKYSFCVAEFCISTVVNMMTLLSFKAVCNVDILLGWGETESLDNLPASGPIVPARTKEV
jgi:hypothetical protein